MRIKRNYIVSKEKDLQARFRGFARAKRAVPLPPFYAPGKSRGSVFWNRGLFFFFSFHRLSDALRVFVDKNLFASLVTPRRVL